MLTVHCDFCRREISPKNQFRISIQRSSGQLHAAGDMCRACVEKCQIQPTVIVPDDTKPPATRSKKS